MVRLLTSIAGRVRPIHPWVARRHFCQGTRSRLARELCPAPARPDRDGVRFLQQKLLKPSKATTWRSRGAERERVRLNLRYAIAFRGR
jgi:hypothetical protein